MDDDQYKAEVLKLLKEISENTSGAYIEGMNVDSRLRDIESLLRSILDSMPADG